jgi:hypothetical protein
MLRHRVCLEYNHRGEGELTPVQLLLASDETTLRTLGYIGVVADTAPSSFIAVNS